MKLIGHNPFSKYVAGVDFGVAESKAVIVIFNSETREVVKVVHLKNKKKANLIIRLLKWLGIITLKEE